MHTCEFEFDEEWSGAGYSLKIEICHQCMSVKITHTLGRGDTKKTTETVVPGFEENFYRKAYEKS